MKYSENRIYNREAHLATAAGQVVGVWGACSLVFGIIGSDSCWRNVEEGPRCGKTSGKLVTQGLLSCPGHMNLS